MSQESVLRIAFDSREAASDAKAFNTQLERVQSGGEKASQSVETLGKTASTTGTAVKGLGTHTESSTKALSDQVSMVDKNALAMKNLAKIVAGYISITKGIEAADGYTQTAARIRNATVSAHEYNLVQDRLLETANTTFRALSEAQEVYLSLAGGMKSLGYSTKQTLDLSDSLSFAFTANATRADQAQSAMDSLSKSMAKGKIDADAWISIVTGADNIIADMAKTTGKTETEIRQLGATGKASLEDLIKTLVATREQNEALANNMENSLKDGLQKLTNETTVFLGKLNETTKLTGHAAAAIGFLSEHIDKLAIVGGVAASIYAGRLAAAFAESAIKAGWSTAAILTQTGAMTASATVAKSLSLALGGPVGLTIGLVGAAASMVMFSKDADTATSSLDIQKNSVAQLTEEYKKLSESKLIAHMDELNKKIADGDSKLSDVKSAITNRMKRSADYVTENTKQQQKFTEALVVSMEKGLSVAEAMQKVKNSKLFDESEIKGLQRQVVLYKDLKIENDMQIMQREVANSQLSKATNLYDENASKIEKLNMEVSQLSESYAKSAENTQKAAEMILLIGENKGATADQLDRAKSAIEEFGKGAITATQLANTLQNALPIPSGTINSFTQQAKETDNLKLQTNKLNSELETENKIKASLINQHPNTLNNLKAETTEKEKQLAVEQKLNDLRKSSLEENTKNQRWINNVNAAGGGEYGAKWGNFMERWLADKKIPYGQALTAEQLKIAHEDFLLLQKREGLQSKITEATQVQAKAEREREKQLDKNNKLLANGARLVGISGNTGKSSGPHLHVQYPMGSKKGGVTAEHMARFQLGGKTLKPNNSNSPYGKVRSDGKKHGGWDFETPVGTPITTNVAVKNVTTHKGDNAGFYSRVTFADGVVIDLMHQVPGIDQKLKGGASDGKSNSLTYKQQESLELKDARESESLSNDYRTITEKDAADHQKRMTDLRKHGLTKEMEMEKARYEKTKELRALEQTLEIDGWRWVGEEKIKNDAAVNRLRIEASTDFNAKEKAAAIQSIEEKRQFEVEAIRLVQQEKQQAYEQEIAKRRRDIDDRMAQSTMMPNDYRRYALVHGQKGEYGANDDQLISDLGDAERQRRDGEFADIQSYYKKLEDAKLLHKENEMAISLEYKKKEADVLRSQYESQLQLWGTLVSQGQTTWSQMTQSVKDGAGEQSSAYKTMFAMQQAFSIASTLVSAHVAASQVAADATIPFFGAKIAASQAMLAMGYASAGLIASQAIAGFATGGAIKGAGTGTSDSIPIMASNGEFMIREFAASKLGAQTLDYINKTGELPYHALQEQILLQQGNSRASVQGFSTGGLVGSPQQSSPMVERQRLVAARESNAIAGGNDPTITIQQTITFDTSNGEAKIDTNGQRALAESLNGAMNNWARRESMQGGVLFNAIRRVR